MPESKYDFFISYAEADAEWARAFLVQPLTAAGLRCITKDRFALGEWTIKEVERAIIGSERVLVVLSNAYFEETWNEYTAILAQSESVDAKKNNFIPINLEDITDLRYRMVVGIDARDANTWDTILPRLEQEIQKPIAGLSVEAKRLFLAEPTRLPFTEDFVGREKELVEFKAKLGQSNLAFIGGLPGVGKTWLASRLASLWRQPERVFWHTFGAGQDIEDLRWKLAQFLAWNGHWEPLRRLHNAAKSGAEREPLVSFFEMLIQAIRNSGYLFCIDNLYLAEKDARLNSLIDLIAQEVRRGGISIIATSREIPNRIEVLGFEPLKGLSLSETTTFLQVNNISTNKIQAAEIHKRTSGNPALLRIAVQVLKDKRIDEVLKRLAKVPNLRKFLFQEISAELVTPEPEVMKAAAVLQSYPGTPDAIQSSMGTQGIEPTLLELTDRYLLHVSEEEFEYVYGEEAFLEEFFYNEIAAPLRIEMHRRLGEYYETHVPDLLKAARHFARAGETVHAATLATVDVPLNLRIGRSRILREVLESLQNSEFHSALDAKVSLALGQLFTVLGEVLLAGAALEKARTHSEALTDSTEDRLLKADICLALGEYYEQNKKPKDSIPLFEQGLAVLGDLDNERKGAFYIKLSSAYLALGDYAHVIDAVSEGQKFVKPRSHWYAKGETNRGIVASDQGDFQTAADYARKTIQIAKELNDKLLTAKGLNNLVFELANLGDREGEINALQKLRVLADELLIFRYQWAARNGLGLFLIEKGDYDEAQNLLTEAIQIGKDRSLDQQQPHALMNLANLKIRMGERDAAIPLLQQAEELALETENDGVKAEICYTRALALLEGDNAQAQAMCRRAIEYAQTQEQPSEQGRAWRALGQALAANQEFDESFAAFEKSLGLLTSPYEIARSETEFARALISDRTSNSAAQDHAREMLMDAQARFQVLGAEKDLAQVKNLLYR